MTDRQLLERFSVNPKVLAGKPGIKGTRLSVEYVLNPLAHGEESEAILEEYEGLNPEDIRARPIFATKSSGREM